MAGNVAGGYGLAGRATFLQHDLLGGIAGLLFSPTRGLFVFSPFLLFLPCRFRQALRDRGTRGLTLALAAAAALQVLLYAKADWTNGAAWGPRWLTDLTPLLVWMLPPVVAALGAVGRAVFFLATCAAIAIEAIGAFWYTGASDVAILKATAGHQRTSAAWDFRFAPYLAELQHPPAPRELTARVTGSIDAVEAGSRRVETVIAGEEMAVTGWALVGHASPRLAGILLDGKPAGSTSVFFTRPDVVSTLSETSPAGWRVSLQTGALAPGEHVVSAYAQAAENGDRHFLGERRFTVLAPPPGDDLAWSFRRAAAVLAADQQAPGYWLTSYTGAPRFADPRREMNTYLTAMLVDLLAPAAGAAGLGENLERARRHLAAQIEDSGLVRYHGRPDAPTIPALGCAITPDADDTALVWRIAPGARRELLPEALATLATYRTDDGLYRTWLAPRDRYRCIDPGKDPNPADAGIQMHVLLLLAQADPPAARALCGALRGAISQDRTWVYYRQAPLVPILRQADLRRAGCALRLPAARLRTAVSGQEPWVAASLQLERFLGADGAAPDPAETLTLLRLLALGDFTIQHHSPPLLYHNDGTASTPRFYWSEDFGYALWLRLYLENARRHQR